MREGFTTGSAAAAAAKAAAGMLLEEFAPDDAPETVSVPLPPIGKDAGGGDAAGLDSAGCARLDIPVAFCRRKSAGTCIAGVVKDGGDDPDATHGALVEAVVSRQREGGEGGKDGEGGMDGQPISMAERVFLYGGPGIGRVTLPGLPVAVGEAAVNPEPRRQIAAALLEAAARAGYEGPLHCLLRVPDGEERAKRTLNSRLGIMGGISILGTRGTVKPYSHDAWRCAIRQGMDVAAALGCRTVCLSTGRRSEKALQALCPALPEQAFIQAADYAGFSLEEAARHGFSRIVWGCFPGKLLKLAQGLGQTHAREGAVDLTVLTTLAREHGAPEAVLREIGTVPTVRGALGVLRAHDPALETAVLDRLAALAFQSLTAMTAAAGTPDIPGPPLTLQVFSLEGVPLTCVAADATGCAP